MVGPVLYLEMLLGGRRGRQYVFRWLYGGWLVVQFLFMYFIYLAKYKTRYALYGYSQVDASATGEFATGFVELFVVQQLILILLATPAFTAGAITDEKTRGTLQHMLTAHLTAAEIVLGKLIGRLAQVLILALVGLPMLCFIGVWGGVHPLLLGVILVSTLAPMFAIGAASILASVWCRTTRDAVIILYAVGALFWILVVTLSAWMPAWLAMLAPGPARGLLELLYKIVVSLHPLDVLRPALEQGSMSEVGRRLLRSVLAWGTIGMVCVGLATWRLRTAYLRQLENLGRKSKPGKAPQRIAVGEEPIRWKERTLEGVAPLAPLRRIPQWVGVLGVFGVTALVCALELYACAKPRKIEFLKDVLTLIGSIDPSAAAEIFLAQGIFVMLIASLVVGIRASGAVSGEREKQTWEALLLTPLQTRELIRGKLGGIFAASVPYLVAYALPAVCLSGLGGFPSLFWTILWLGVTALAMYYVGAAGIWCSTRSASSWRSLLGTLGFGYVGGFLIFVVASPVTLIIAFIIYIFLGLADALYGTGFTKVVGGWKTFHIAFLIATCAALALIFFFTAKGFLNAAEKRVSDRERIRHWKEEPFRRGPNTRRPAPPRSLRN